MKLLSMRRPKLINLFTIATGILVVYYFVSIKYFTNSVTFEPNTPALFIEKTEISSNKTQIRTALPTISMRSYVRGFNVEKEFQVCTSAIRPDPKDIVWRKNVYQHFKWRLKRPYNDQDVFILNHYFDDRFFSSHKYRFVRAPIAVKGPGPLTPAEFHRDTLLWAWAMNKMPFFAMLWYNGFENPISVFCAHKGASGLVRNVSNAYYFQQMMYCPLPEINMLPSHVSISYDRCAKPQTLTEVVFPTPPRFPGSRDIGVCMASLYGSMNKTMLPYFVNWMEALNLFGVIEVSMNNASFQFGDKEIEAAFQYYINKGQLIFTHYPVVHPTWPRTRKYDDDATESVNKLTTGDCYNRNLKRYWYTLIIDIDELPVPTRHKTYVEFLQEYLDKNPNLTDAHCLTIRSAFYYLDFAPGNNKYGAHLPVLRHTGRFRPEPVEGSHDGVGISKSFHNPRNCVASGHHLCRQGHDIGDKYLKRQYMPPEDILIHHYRAFCKYKKDCKTMKNDIQYDDVLPTRFGSEITARVENVLTELNFFFNKTI